MREKRPPSSRSSRFPHAQNPLSLLFQTPAEQARLSLAGKIRGRLGRRKGKKGLLRSSIVADILPN